MNILFLDFDGVICTIRASVSVGESGVLGYLDPVALGLLEIIVKKYDVKIVVSSTWRIGRDYRDFVDLFKAAGFNRLAQSILYSRTDSDIWKTSTKNRRDSRGYEIDDWLKKYANVDDNYVILDDDSNMLPEQLEHFVHCSNECDGLLWGQYLQCCHIFEGNPLSSYSSNGLLDYLKRQIKDKKIKR